MNEKLVTRFAPSPTGYLHIGGARTALFNWLYAKHFGGKFLLRIEDTDRQRSTDDAIKKIFEGLNWLGLNWDEEPIFQFSRANTHADVALDLVKQGKAYFCYCSTEELEKMRNDAINSGKSPKYNGMWRDKDISAAPKGIKPVVRLKANQNGKTILNDMVQGKVVVENSELDDLILLRADGTPTYMLSVVVDDHDMEITHVIRGDDHLTNTFRQMQIYEACGWDTPKFAHIPLIHGPDGSKLSKRHGALGIENYKDMGFLPEAMCNYLLRLGWSHGDEEIINIKKAVEWFDGEKIGKSPSRLDITKLTNINAHYIRESDNARLLTEISKILNKELSNEEQDRIFRGMDGLKQRAKLITELADSSRIYFDEFEPGKIEDENMKNVLDLLKNQNDWSHDNLEIILRNLAEEIGIKFGNIAQSIRFALSNNKVSPSIFDMMIVLGKEETLRRLEGSMQ